MNRCNFCNVNVFESEKNCPLCHRDLDGTYKADTAVKYPEYKVIVSQKSHLHKLPLFVSVVAAIICVYVNIFTHSEGGMLWSVIVVASLIFANSTYYTARSTAKRFGAKVLIYYLLLSALVVVIDFTAGGYFWSTNYVFPFLTLGTILYLTVLSIRSKHLFSEYFGYILVVMLIGIVPIIVFLLGFSTVMWGVYIAAVSCAIVLIGLILFFFKNLKQELNKRFHR